MIAFGPLSIDLYLPAFTQVGADFGVPTSHVEWSLASFFAGLSIGQLFYGLAADRFGRKPPLYFGMILYIFASAGCAMATSIEALVALRFLQALGACAGMVVSRAMVRDLFEPRESAKVFSMLMLVMGLAPILAPLIGGMLIQVLHWNALFWILSGLSVLCLVGIHLGLPETRAPNPQVKIAGAFRSYWSVFRDREFFWNAMAGGLAQAGLFAYITGSPYVLIEYFGVPSSSYGLYFGANALGLITVSQLNARWVHRWGPTVVLRRAIRSISFFSPFLVVGAALNLGLWAVAVGLFGYVATMGAIFPNSTAGALASQGHRAGVASALVGTLQFMLASVSSGGVSALHAQNAVPMVATIAVCGGLAYLASRRIVKFESGPTLRE